LLVWLIEATSGNIYGTTYSGGAKNSSCTSRTCGTVFKITLADALTTLHSFDRTDAALPTALIQDTNGTFTGTTIRGGTNAHHYCGGSCGTIFSCLSVSAPFAERRMTPAWWEPLSSS
jgi:uncharacterized repeat protein (TIGR03803 family)